MTAFRKKTGKKATSDRDRYRNSGSEEVILLQRSKHFKDNVTNPSSKEGKTPVLKKEASQALCKYGRQTDRQTLAPVTVGTCILSQIKELDCQRWQGLHALEAHCL